MLRKDHQQGFTLVELVMVVVIIGVLSAIIVPNYVDYVGKSSASTTKANLQMLRTALQSYRSENNGSIPGNLSTALVPLYLPVVPPDGVNQLSTVVSTLDGTGGWHYVAATGIIKPNLSGVDAYGINYSAY